MSRHDPDPLVGLLDRWRPFRVLVVGDFMLDQLCYGDADRLSADAPVPVLHVRRTESRPGGAANVCLDLAAMGAAVDALGVCGTDAESADLRAALAAAGIDPAALVADPSRPTTVKRSLIGMAQHRHPQKMFRVDYESRDPVAPAMIDRLVEACRAGLAGADAVVMEDYGKGVCTPDLCSAVIGLARGRGVPVFVDPAPIDDYSRYRGCSAITPNRTEAERASGRRTSRGDDPRGNAEVAEAIMAVVGCDAVVLTLDRHGALVLPAGGAAEAVPTVAREVYDVTGAGDMFLAALAAARVNGAGWVDAARLANAAAGLEVEVFGVQPIPLERIAREVHRLAGAASPKVAPPAEVLARVAGVRRRGGRVVFTNGCFDIIHSGHVALLEQARAKGDYLVVAINDDASVRRLKGPGRPVNPQADRARVLAAFEAVDAVVIFSEDTPVPLLEAIRPDVLVKGGDYTLEGVVGRDRVESWGGRVELVRAVDGRSTSSVIDRIAGHRG